MRVINLILTLVFIISILQCEDAYAKRKLNIRDLFKNRDMLKVHVAEVANSSGNNKIDLKALRQSIEDALAARITQRFEIVRDASVADVKIETEITEYIWTDKDPIDMLAGIAGIVYDAVKTDNYACMTVIVIITDIDSGEQLWTDKLMATATSSSLTEEDSYSLMNKRIAKVFMRELYKLTKARQ